MRLLRIPVPGAGASAAGKVDAVPGGPAGVDKGSDAATGTPAGVATGEADAVEATGPDADGVASAAESADNPTVNVSRETSSEFDTPIGAAAERAMRVLHTTHDPLKPPHQRRVFTIANQKGASVRPPPPSTSRRPWRSKDSRHWLSISTRRATRAPHSGSPIVSRAPHRHTRC